MKNSPEVTHICACLAGAAGLPATQHANGGELDWRRWLDLVEAERLEPFMHCRAAAGLPEDVQTELRLAYAREGRNAFLRAVEMQRILEAVRKETDFIVLKGAALLDSLYRESAERAMWDVDLLFRDDASLALAQAALQARGFTTGKNLPAHHHAPALKHEFRVLGVELHTNLVTPPLPAAFIQELWDRRVATSRGFHVLDPVGQVIHHAIHALNDPLESPLLRNLFELAWMAQRLTPAQQADLKVTAPKWNISAEVGRGLALASRLFGSPSILEAPRASFYEFWCLRRLEWPPELHFAGRVMRHVAHDHIRKMRRGAGTRNIFPIIGIFFDWFFQSLERRIRAAAAPVRHARGHAVDVDECVIFSNERTGEIHLLNPDAARVFKDLDGPSSVVRTLKRSGVFTSTSDASPPTAPAAPRPS